MHKVARSSQVAKSSQAENKTRPAHKTYWAALLLLPLGLMLPLIGELLQTLLIGEEYVCCMPDNLDQLLARAETAKNLRWLSNLIIGGSMVIGIALVIFAFAMFYRKIVPSLSRVHRRLTLIIMGVVCIYIISVLITMLLFFIFCNDYYFGYRPWPGGSLYYDAWFSPVYWLKVTFF